MQFIDFHTHVYPETIAAKATAATCAFYDLTLAYTGTPEEKSKLDAENGIYKSVLLPVAVQPKHVQSVNEFTRSTALHSPGFLPFGTVHAADDALLPVAQGLLDNGFYGIKIHPDMQGFDIDDERLFPFYDFVQGKLPVIFHTGDPRYDRSHPAKLKRVLHEFPRLVVIAAHLGGWSFQETAFPLLKNEERCFVDTSSSILYQTEEENMRYIRGYGTERVLFGSDFPMDDPVAQQKTLLSLPLTDGEKEMIACRNAEYFIKTYCFGR